MTVPKDSDTRQTILLLATLFSFIYETYLDLGLEGLRDITNPSLDDILNIFNKMDKEIPASQINPKQAILLAIGLINSLKSKNIDEKAFEAQIKSIINTQLHRD